MSVKRRLLTLEQYDQIGVVDGWKVSEVPQRNWSSINGIQRLDDTLAIYASGSISDTRVLNDIEAIAGLDQLVYERKPRNSEPDGNAYHYVVQKTNNVEHPYILNGPFRKEARIEHWFEDDDLGVYLATINGTEDE